MSSCWRAWPTKESTAESKFLSVPCAPALSLDFTTSSTRASPNSCSASFTASIKPSVKITSRSRAPMVITPRVNLASALMPSGRSPVFQALEASGSPPENGFLVSRANVGEFAAPGIELCKKAGGEAAAAQAVGAGIAVQPFHQVEQRGVGFRQGPHAGLKRGHEQSRGNAFPRHIRHHQQQSLRIGLRVRRGCAGRRRNSLRPRYWRAAK